MLLKSFFTSLVVFLHPQTGLSVQFRFPHTGSTFQPLKPAPNPGFVQVRYDAAERTHHFYLGDRLFDFRGFNAPTLLSNTVFEIEDLLQSISGFGTPVTRTYTLITVANTVFGGTQNPANALIHGWDYERGDWIYNEPVFEHQDRVLAMAARAGVKLIIPMVNQDYGTADTDFVGNFNDLIRHRYNISNYRAANTLIDWFTDRNIREAYKKLIEKVLTRRNTFNGRVYGQDDTIMAWETGNEMNWGRENNTIHDRPAPANWTLEIVQHIKRFAPNTLVMDGSYARSVNGSIWPLEVLQSDLVDLISYHLYGDSDIKLYLKLENQAKKYNKTLVIGEHGFYSTSEVLQEAYNLYKCPGALVWSLRAHGESGGFETHSEGNNIYSYHVPGWDKQTSSKFDTREAGYIRNTFEASYQIIQKLVPNYPIPNECYPFYLTNSTHTGLSWKGAAWARNYEIWAVATEGGLFQKVASNVSDNVEEGSLFVAIDPLNCKLIIPKRAEVPVQDQTGYVDSKWPDSKVIKYITQKNQQITGEAKLVKQTRHWLNPRQISEPNELAPIPKGSGWYSVRPISADGYKGPFSKPVYIKSI